MSERPQPPIRAPLIPVDRAIVDEDGRPTLDFWRAFEALRARLGGAEDLPFALAAYSENTAAQLSDISDRISRLEATIAAKDAIDQRGLEDLERQLIALAGRTDSVEASAQQSLEELQRRFSAAQAGFEQILLRPSGIDVVTDDVVARNAAIKNRKIDYPRQESIYDQSDAGQLSEVSGERTLLQVSFSDVGTPHFVTAAATQLKFRNDGSGNQASVAGLTFTLRLRIGSADMSSHSYGGNQTVYSATATSSTDGGLTTFIGGGGPLMLLSSSIFSFPATGGTQYAALTGELTGGGGSDTCNIADDETKLVITGFANIEV